MSTDSELSIEFLSNVSFMLQVCAADADADADESEAAANVCGRLAEWLHLLMPMGPPRCELEMCDLPATEWTAERRRCPYHND